MASLKKKRKADAAAFLAARHYYAVIPDIEERIKQLTERVWTPARDDQKIELIAIAYAMLLLYRRDATMIAGLTKPGRRGVDRSDPARVFVEALYFDEISESVPRTKLLSRWTMAVRYLDEKKMKPSEVEALAAVRGEGIDKWSKAHAKQRQADRLLKSGSATVRTKSALVTIKIGDDATQKWKVADASHLAAIIVKLKTVGEVIPLQAPTPSKPG
ncbi:hypothetical protein ACLI1C_15330 [Devosia sp. XGJD_8]|uniref:hypothetical protein n=1 Tax=Devosia sp. XGJD_8 TaxID=3391187 RepID=UPI003984867E